MALLTTALVAGVSDPIDNRLRFGRPASGWVRILVTGDTPIFTARREVLTPERWLARGEEIPVALDAAAPGGFEILWDEIPPMAARAAAGTPALADPLDAHRRVLAGLILAGVAGQGVPLPPRENVGALARQAIGNVLHGRDPSAGMRDPFLDTLHANAGLIETGHLEVVRGHFDESLAAIATRPAAPGRVRAGVLFSAHAATLKSDGTDSGSRYYDRHGKHQAVLSVHVPGRDPYAVYVEKFDHKKGKASDFMAALPAEVSASNPTDVEVKWDELLSSREYTRQRRDQALGEAAERMAAYQAARGNQPSNAIEQYRTSARRALEMTRGGPSRQMVIDQYRQLGVTITDDGEVVD
jgi:hypothetical protein